MRQAPFLQFRGCSLLLGYGDFEISVSAPQFVDHFLFFSRILQYQIVRQAEHTAHVGRLDPYHLTGGGVGVKNIVEYAGVV